MPHTWTLGAAHSPGLALCLLLAPDFAEAFKFKLSFPVLLENTGGLHLAAASLVDAGFFRLEDVGFTVPPGQHTSRPCSRFVEDLSRP